MSVCAIDTSAIIAIAFDEPTADAVLHRLSGYRRCVIGAPTVVQSRMVFASRRPAASEDAIANLLTLLNVDTVGFTAAMQAHAWQAWLRYGKGRHPASLNYGDCMSYGLAAAFSAALLFVGNDFSRTGIGLACGRSDALFVYGLPQ